MGLGMIFRLGVRGYVVMLALAVFAVVVLGACGVSDEPKAVATVVVAAAPEATAAPTATVAVQAEPTATEEAEVEEPVATAMVVATKAPMATTVAPAATVAPEPVVEAFDTSRFADIDEIVDPTNFGWPRSVETSEGVIFIDAAPMNLHSVSLGHSEILAALMDFDRLSAVYSFFVDEEQSNIAELSANATMIGFAPEEVVALEPEIILASRYTSADTIALMGDAGIPVARTSLESSALGNVPNILLIGYMIGAEVEAIALADDIEARMSFITDILAAGVDKPRVLSVSKWTNAFAAGSGTTEGGIIEQAGGINAAGDSGIEGHHQVSIESIAAINPDVIIVPQPLDGANVYIAELVGSPALAEVPAVKNGAIYYVAPRYHTTLSHWNVRGIEQLATLLFPSLFSGVEFEEFSQWGGGG
jgi:iron complex transport system substrate-binding protein